MRPLSIILASVLAVAAAIVSLPAAAGAEDDPWQAVKAATARYHSVEQAEKAGYVRDPHCAFSPLGGMGYHYVNPSLMADDALDPLEPEVLVYAPTESGKLKLVAVEYWKRDDDQLLFTSGDRPVLYGRGFDGPMPGHNATMPVHYDLHVWLFAENPNGMFAPFNPAVTCTP
jgi:hypothetical protein